MPGTRKLGRPTEQRMAMLRGQVTLFLDNGSIKTTVTRAKEIKSLAEKMITLGKANTLAAKRQAMEFITKEDVVKKLFDTIAPSFADRNGGYTRLYRIGTRRGDGAEVGLLELVNLDKTPKKETKKTAKKAAPKADDAAEKTEAKKPDAKKPAAKKPAAKKADAAEKPAAKKTAAKADDKPAAKKPAAKKPAAKKATEKKSDAE